MDENPYKSPAEAKTVQDVPAKGFLAGVIRGARFGGLVGMAIGIVLVVVGLVLAASIPVIRAREPLSFSSIGGAAFGVLLCGFYGAATGSVVNGIAWVVKRNKR